MGEEITEIELYAAFPQLINDADFKVTSPLSPNYNCIAWALHYDDRWMWPGGVEAKNLDGFHYWPDGVEDNEDVTSFIEAFQLKDYKVCDKWEHEEGYRRIALYVKEGTTECTHAARELSSGKWTSKLGKDKDIQHGTPFSIEGPTYGKVYCFMKIEFM